MFVAKIAAAIAANASRRVWAAMWHEKTDHHFTARKFHIDPL
jgi:hypothetical protein